MWKKIGIGLIILLAIIAGAVWYLVSNLDSLIKAAIEKYGSAATQTSVTVGGVKLSLGSGAGTISGLSIGNPPGFTSPQALGVGAIMVQLDTSSLPGNGPIVVRTINIAQPQMNYEVIGGVSLTGVSTSSNLLIIQNNVKNYAGRVAAAPPQGGTPARKEIINDLYVTGGEVNLIATTVLHGKKVTVPLPPIHLTNIGRASGGATPAQIASQIINAVTSQAAKTGAAALTQQVKAAAGGALPGNVGGTLKGLLGP
ncbi:hypothetical protein GCM10010909_25880 [Acidocella aquatica]|uniref:AsmA domain-containing protein n=1 Tax=Acidocella aquatica TaxID=1922313 RepID=A0ABQ6A859_9PROT|nr:hypothetical protein [Acidocella aquatica]GLR67907.1 hypothetical protein GCM10010909_25880 [Acidocella aquatica]